MAGLIAAVLHILAATYIGYVALRDSDANPLYFMGVCFFLASAAELLVQRFRNAPTRAYALVTILNVIFVPFVVIGCLTIIGNIFNNNASPLLVLGTVAMLALLTTSSLMALQPARVLAPGRSTLVMVAVTTICAAAVLAMPHFAGALVMGAPEGGYTGLAGWLNRVAALQGVATTVLIGSWLVLVGDGIARRRQMGPR